MRSPGNSGISTKRPPPLVSQWFLEILAEPAWAPAGAHDAAHASIETSIRVGPCRLMRVFSARRLFPLGGDSRLRLAS